MAFAGFTLPDVKDSDLSDKKERRQILEYLYQLTEQLRFVLGNLDEENFTDAFKETVDTGGKLTQITQRLEDAKRGLTTVRKQTAEGFTQVASRITENEQAVAEVKQTAEGITQKVSRMVDKDQVVSAINQSAEEIAIQANRINLNGAVTANEHFKINLDGSIEAKSGRIGGFMIGEKGELEGVSSIAVAQMTMTGDHIWGLKISAENILRDGEAYSPPQFLVRGARGNFAALTLEKLLTFIRARVTINGTVYNITLSPKDGNGESEGDAWYTDSTAVAVVRTNWRIRSTKTTSTDANILKEGISQGYIFLHAFDEGDGWHRVERVYAANKYDDPTDCTLWLTYGQAYISSDAIGRTVTVTYR